MALITSALMVALSVAVPFMDRTDSSAGPTIEAGHHGAVCTLHDHTLCTQVGANLALVVETVLAGRLPAMIPLLEALSSEAPKGRFLTKTHPARAPPYQRA